MRGRGRARTPRAAPRRRRRAPRRKSTDVSFLGGWRAEGPGPGPQLPEERLDLVPGEVAPVKSTPVQADAAHQPIARVDGGEEGLELAPATAVEEDALDVGLGLREEARRRRQGGRGLGRKVRLGGAGGAGVKDHPAPEPRVEEDEGEAHR